MQDIKEEWRDIPNYEGLYQVSNLGRVRSLDRIVRRNDGVDVRHKSRILKPRDNGNGYLYVDIHNGGITKRMYIHRLVAMAFLSNPNGYDEINHKSDIKSDNSVGNLEWCNRSYNASYGTKIQRTVNTCQKNGVYKKSLDLKTELGIYGGRKSVAMCDADWNVLRIFRSIMDAARCINVNPGKICECCKGSRNQTRGYKWKYYEEYKSI